LISSNTLIQTTSLLLWKTSSMKETHNPTLSNLVYDLWSGQSLLWEKHCFCSLLTSNHLVLTWELQLQAFCVQYGKRN
jgi:hypothetical protein